MEEAPLGIGRLELGLGRRHHSEVLDQPVVLRTIHDHAHAEAAPHGHILDGEMRVGIEVDGVLAVVVVLKTVESVRLELPDALEIAVRRIAESRHRILVATLHRNAGPHTEDIRHDPLVLRAEVALGLSEGESAPLAEPHTTLVHRHHLLHGNGLGKLWMPLIVDKRKIDVGTFWM